MLSNKWTIYIDEHPSEAILSAYKNKDCQVLGESHKDFNSAIQSLITPAHAPSTSESSGEVDNLRQALKDIALYNNGFIEYFRRHGYRLMYELWERVYAIATAYPFPAPSNQGSGQDAEKFFYNHRRTFNGDEFIDKEDFMKFAASVKSSGQSYPRWVKAKYQEWRKETKRNGAVLVGGSINEFFDWLEETPSSIQEGEESKGDSVEKFRNEVRQAFADYYASEGCSCCQNIDSHKEANMKLATLLKADPYEDNSGANWYKYKS